MVDVRELRRLRSENAALRAELADLRRDLEVAREDVDIARFVYRDCDIENRLLRLLLCDLGHEDVAWRSHEQLVADRLGIDEGPLTLAGLDLPGPGADEGTGGGEPVDDGGGAGDRDDDVGGGRDGDEPPPRPS